MQYRGVTEYELLLDGDPKAIQSHMIEYVLYLRNQNLLTGRSINARLNALQKFYDTNDVELKWKKIKLNPISDREKRG